jgi:hypothetical protein
VIDVSKATSLLIVSVSHAVNKQYKRLTNCSSCSSSWSMYTMSARVP